MMETLTRLGVDLGPPTLVAYAVVALVAGLLGVAVGSFLELLRTRRLARRALYEEVPAARSYDEPAVAYEAPAFAYGPALAYGGVGGLDAPSEPGLEDWFTGSGLGGVRRRPRNRSQLAFAVALALLVVAATFGAAAALLGWVPPEIWGY